MKHVSGGVEISVLTRKEHPPPHVHVEHQAEGWEIKVHFSYIENIASTYRILHIYGKLPSRVRLNRLLSDIMSSRQECRTEWWRHVADVGLQNQKVVVHKGLASPASSGDAQAFLVKTAIYMEAADSVNFNANVIGKCP